MAMTARTKIMRKLRNYKWLAFHGSKGRKTAIPEALFGKNQSDPPEKRNLNKTESRKGAPSTRSIKGIGEKKGRTSQFTSDAG